MYCKNCGTKIDDTSKFCMNCGEKTEVVTADAPNYGYYTYQNPVSYNPPVKKEKEHYAPGSFADTFHKYGRSKKFMISSIMASLVLFVNFTSAFSALGNITSGAELVFGLVELLFSTAVLGLLCPALWIIYGASRNPKYPESSLGSMKLIKTGIWVNFVHFLFNVVLFLKEAPVFSGKNYDISMYGRMYLTSEFSSILNVMIIIAVVIAVALYAYYAVKIYTVTSEFNNGLKYNNVKEVRGVKGYALFTYIVSGITLFSTFAESSISGMGSVSGAAVIELLAAVASIMIAVLISSVANEHKNKNYNYPEEMVREIEDEEEPEIEIEIYEETEPETLSVNE